MNSMCPPTTSLPRDASLPPAAAPALARYFVIGAGSDGCHAFDQYSKSGHTYGSSTTVFGSLISTIARSASRITLICSSRSPACPSGCPNGNSTPTILGVPTASASHGDIVTSTVLIPAASIARASTGTYRQHSGQTGVRKAQSTSSLFIRSAISGP